MKKLVKTVLSAWPVLRSICVGGCLVLGAEAARVARADRAASEPPATMGSQSEW